MTNLVPARSSPPAELATLSSLIELRIATRSSEKSRQTLRDSFLRIVRVLRRKGIPIESVDDIPVTKIDAAYLGMIRELLEESEPALGPSTIRQTLGDLRTVVKAAYHRGLLPHHQMEGLREVRVTGSRLTKGRALSDAELVALLGRCDAIGGVKGSMLRGVLLVGVGTGLRISELCYSPMTKRGLRVDSVSPVDGHLHVVGKGNKENACVLDAVTRRALDAWLEVRRDLPWRHVALFGTPSRGRILRPNWLWKMLERLAKDAGVPRFSPHDLRRTFATRMLDRLDLREVQILMMHADPKTTGKYDKRGAEALAAKRRGVTVFDPGEVKEG